MIKYRNLKNGEKAKELNSPMNLIIKTKCPTKWIIEDLETGGVYKGQKGDLFYWAPGHRHHIGGKFKAFYVKTPVPLRWTVSPEGKRVFDMLNLANETSYPSSPPNERNMPPITNSD